MTAVNWIVLWQLTTANTDSAVTLQVNKTSGKPFCMVHAWKRYHPTKSLFMCYHSISFLDILEDPGQKINPRFREAKKTWAQEYYTVETMVANQKHTRLIRHVMNHLSETPSDIKVLTLKRKGYSRQEMTSRTLDSMLSPCAHMKSVFFALMIFKSVISSGVWYKIKGVMFLNPSMSNYPLKDGKALSLYLEKK